MEKDGDQYIRGKSAPLYETLGSDVLGGGRDYPKRPTKSDGADSSKGFFEGAGAPDSFDFGKFEPGNFNGNFEKFDFSGGQPGGQIPTTIEGMREQAINAGMGYKFDPAAAQGALDGQGMMNQGVDRGVSGGGCGMTSDRAMCATWSSCKWENNACVWATNSYSGGSYGGASTDMSASCKQANGTWMGYSYNPPCQMPGSKSCPSGQYSCWSGNSSICVNDGQACPSSSGGSYGSSYSGSCPSGQYWYTPPGGGSGYCTSSAGASGASTCVSGGGWTCTYVNNACDCRPTTSYSPKKSLFAQVLYSILNAIIGSGR